MYMAIALLHTIPVTASAGILVKNKYIFQKRAFSS
jgi:hypothetical protein